MKITKKKLENIIKEELAATIKDLGMAGLEKADSMISRGKKALGRKIGSMLGIDSSITVARAKEFKKDTDDPKRGKYYKGGLTYRQAALKLVIKKYGRTLSNLTPALVKSIKQAGGTVNQEAIPLLVHFVAIWGLRENERDLPATGRSQYGPTFKEFQDEIVSFFDSTGKLDYKALEGSPAKRPLYNVYNFLIDEIFAVTWGTKGDEFEEI